MPGTPSGSLHLVRLAQATPDTRVALPGSAALAALHVTRKTPDAPSGAWYVLLDGELVLDLPGGQFAHLRAGETYFVPDGAACTLTPVGAATILTIHDA
ncbi:hypothetical protein [Deinococcus maricopensis]|uniref:Cupin 2 conserved barrel domain protein n=1 Tax=Deinococcus maricopensis (strain DSM 21211 / LMG 22137 / NRRL B-23946 / LB-34) TaxID=709986 RepID=E8UB99_DEIML|nr:hypothetical protein [Deinococcus maricopensis]ADV68338.1 hypothetical protein Deima_2708 [Deinococcus maricopensis DSM 21211]